MRLLVTGGSSLLGSNLAFIAAASHEVHATYHRHPVTIPGCRMHPLDLTDEEAEEPGSGGAEVLGSLLRQGDRGTRGGGERERECMGARIPHPKSETRNPKSEIPHPQSAIPQAALTGVACGGIIQPRN